MVRLEAKKKGTPWVYGLQNTADAEEPFELVECTFDDFATVPGILVEEYGLTLSVGSF